MAHTATGHSRIRDLPPSMSKLIVHGGTPLQGRIIPSSNKNAVLHNFSGGTSSILKTVEGSDSNAFIGRLGHQLQCCLSHDSQGTLAANKQLRKVVTSGRLAGTLLSLDNSTVGENNGQRKSVLSHSTITVRVGARAASTNHTGDLGARTGIRAEKEVMICQVFIEFLPVHSRLHNNVKILLVQSNDLVHAGKVQGNTTVNRREMTL